MNLGMILTSPKARTRKDTRARVMHRHHIDHRPSRVLLLDDQHGQGREVRCLLVPAVFLANLPLHRLLYEGGDWDHRNRLKVYTGLHFLSIRQFKHDGELLLNALSTFTATELLSYAEFVGLTVIANTLGLKRVDLKKVRAFYFCPIYPSLTRTHSQLINTLEVNQVLPVIPVLGNLVKNLYEYHHEKVFVALSLFSPHSQPRQLPLTTPRFPATLEQTHLIPSHLLSPHARFYTREMRILAYMQLLENYRSLTLDNLCSAFGVDKNWVDV